MSLLFNILIFIVIVWLVRYFISLSKEAKERYKREFNEWLLSMENKHNYDEDIVRSFLSKLSKESFELFGDSLPYGRSRWFVEGEQSFKLSGDAELEYFGITPVRSKIENDFSEYGLLLTQDGLFYKCQKEVDDNKEKKYKTVTEFFPFDGLWKCDYKDGNCLFFYPERKREFKSGLSDEKSKKLVKNLNDLIQTGYTADLYKNYIEKEFEEGVSSVESQPDIETGVSVGSLLGLNMVFGNHLKNIQFNPIASARMGHGYAAEYANDRVDQLKNPFVKVQQIGQNNQKNGADRIVGDQQIQTKYHSRAISTVNSAFDSKVNGGRYRYNGMQLEVPKDQYNESIQIMKKKIQEGKVPGHTDPKDAYQIIRKGNVTYNEAKLIAKGGNITSLKYDALDGSIQSLPVAGISFVIVFAQAKWSGSTIKEASRLALRAGVRTMVIGTVVYASSQQIGKVFSQKIASITGKKIVASTIAKRAAGVISFGIVVGPDAFDFLTGRISKQQLLKNSLIAGSGFIGGAAMGAAAGSVVPVVGTFVGAVAGAAFATNKMKDVLDNHIEDDRIKMFAILKEEFIDVVMSISLSEKEFKEVQDKIFDKNLQNKLKEMYKNRQSSKNRKFTRENLVESVVEKVISVRKQVDEIEILEAVEFAENEFAVFTDSHISQGVTL